MARNQTIRLRPIILKSDAEAIAALRTLGGYVPTNPAYSKTAMLDALAAMESAQRAELAAQNALASARDNAAAAEWQLHNMVLSLKEQVVALYGKNSNQIQALGMKKKSEYKPRTPRKKSA